MQRHRGRLRQLGELGRRLGVPFDVGADLAAAAACRRVRLPACLPRLQSARSLLATLTFSITEEEEAEEIVG